MATKRTCQTILPKNLSLLKSSVLSVSLALTILSCSSNNQAKNFYPREEIPRIIEKLSKEEFNLDVKAALTANCLWVYLPQEKLLDANFNFLETASLNFDHASLIIGRVILNTLDPPQFYVLVTSDIKSLGLDYVVINYVRDLKRYYYSRISRGESAKRRVFQFKLNLMALNDTEGSHIAFKDIDMREFLTDQLRKRIEDKLKEEPFKKLISVKSVNAAFKDGRFIFDLDFSRQEAPAAIDFSKEALKIIAAVLKDYDFKDFEEITINETAPPKSITLSQKALLENYK